MVNELFMDINPELSVRFYGDNLDKEQEMIINEIRKISPNVRTRLAGYHNKYFLKILVNYKSYDEYNETVEKLMGIIPKFCDPNLYLNLTYYKFELDTNTVYKKSTIYTGEEWRDEARSYCLYNTESIDSIKRGNQENINATRLSDFMRR